MTLNESIGRFHVRKTLRFEMKPVGKTADYLSALLAGDEERAESLNTVKAVIEAEHRALIRRVFHALPDPLPPYDTIKEAFKADPQYALLTGRGANAVMQLVLDRCHYNHWAIPKQVRDLVGWQPLFIKWHWHCFEPYACASANRVALEWAGRPKALVEATSAFLAPCKKRKPTRNYWFDHAPFRMMFDNHACGMSWLKEDFHISRTFLLKDGARVLVGIVPRTSKFNPHALACPAPNEPAYLLYEEIAGQKPRLHPIPRARVDIPADRGFVYLFELTGRGLRGNTNLNAIYLRALLSDGNFDNPSLHLDKVCEFYVRKGTDLPRDGKPAHFRQRFTEDKFFVALHVTCNPQLIAVPNRPMPFGDLAKFIANHPQAKFIEVASVTGGYRVDGTFVSSREARSGLLAGKLAKLAVARDASVIFDPSVPEPVMSGVVDKFGYIVVRGRDALAEGGALRGYQLVDRLFVGRVAESQVIANDRSAKRVEKEMRMVAMRKAAEEARLAAIAARQAGREKNDEELRTANARRALREKTLGGGTSTDVFERPIFKTGKLLFKFGYKTSDNMRHEYACRGDSKADVFQKLRTVGVRPYRVECDDAAFVAEDGELPPARDKAKQEKPLDIGDRLKRLDGLKAQGLLSEAEYSEQRAKIIAEL